MAGAAAAAFLARRGRSVLVLERARFPREKACGEGILPHGVRVLRRLGRCPDHGVLTRGIRIRVGSRDRVLPFPSGPGMAVRRLHLDAALLGLAREAGARVLREAVHRVSPGEVVTSRGIHRGRILVGADGCGSIFHRAFGVRRREDRGRIGVSTHLTGFEAEPDLVEVVVFQGGELYLAPVEAGVTLAALLLDRGFAGKRGLLGGARSGRILDVIREAAGERASGASVAAPVHASAPLSTRVGRVAGERWLLAGDAAGRIDPISGQGLSVALASGEMAAEAIDAHLGRGTPLAGYASRLRRFREPLERVTRLLLLGSRHHRLASFLLGREGAATALLMAATGEAPRSWLRLVGKPAGPPRPAGRNSLATGT